MIRILRIIEYVYDSPEIAESDMTHWIAPAIGSIEAGPHKTIRSTIITDLNFEPETPDA